MSIKTGQAHTPSWQARKGGSSLVRTNTGTFSSVNSSEFSGSMADLSLNRPSSPISTGWPQNSHHMPRLTTSPASSAASVRGNSIPLHHSGSAGQLAANRPSSPNSVESFPDHNFRPSSPASRPYSPSTAYMHHQQQAPQDIPAITNNSHQVASSIHATAHATDQPWHASQVSPGMHIPPSRPLPPGWTEFVASTGQPYYYNHARNETTWEHP